MLGGGGRVVVDLHVALGEAEAVAVLLEEVEEGLLGDHGEVLLVLLGLGRGEQRVVLDLEPHQPALGLRQLHAEGLHHHRRHRHPMRHGRRR